MAIQSQTAQRQPAPKVDADKTEVREQPSQDPAAVVDAATLTVAKSEKKDQGNGENGSQKDKEDEQFTTTEQLKKAVETINKNVTHSEAVFGIHEKTNRITIKIVDKDTKELIMELPPEKTLDMIAKAWELAGLLIDERR
jgi:flagellar protein FlaG